MLADEEDRDLHLPHYIELFGGVVFLEPLRHFEYRLRKALAVDRRGPHDRRPGDDRPGRRRGGGRAD